MTISNEFRSSVERNSKASELVVLISLFQQAMGMDNIIDLLSGGKSVDELATSLNLNPAT